MENNQNMEMPRYGENNLDTHEYSNKKLSGLPESYKCMMLNLVSEQVKKSGGIFIDIGGGKGELAKQIEENTGIKSIAVDYSSVGLMENNSAGVVGKASVLPIVKEIAGILHIKDVIEHFNDRHFVLFINEAKRLLVKEGQLVITEKDYFPSTQKPWVSVFLNGTKLDNREPISFTEEYPEIVTRLKHKYTEEVKAGILYYPRSKEKIISELSKMGFKHVETTKWKPNVNEPDWFGARISRNVMTFSVG